MDINEKKQTVLLENRSKLVIDNIINVESFNDDYLELASKAGEICIEGANLKIEELRQDDGKIIVSGEIIGVFYKERKTNKGIFSSIFK